MDESDSDENFVQKDPVKKSSKLSLKRKKEQGELCNVDMHRTMYSYIC